MASAGRKQQGADPSETENTEREKVKQTKAGSLKTSIMSTNSDRLQRKGEKMLMTRPGNGSAAVTAEPEGAQRLLGRASHTDILEETDQFL